MCSSMDAYHNARRAGEHVYLNYRTQGVKEPLHGARRNQRPNGPGFSQVQYPSSLPRRERRRCLRHLSGFLERRSKCCVTVQRILQ